MAQISKKVELSSDKSSLKQVEPILMDVKKEFDIKDDVFYNVMIAVTEAVNNAIIHGNKMKPEKKVNFELKTKGRTIIIIIKDEGEGFDPDNIDDCLKPENLMKDGGRGVFLIKELMDDVDFKTTEEGTTLTMKFNVNENDVK